MTQSISVIGYPQVNVLKSLTKAFLAFSSRVRADTPRSIGGVDNYLWITSEGVDCGGCDRMTELEKKNKIVVLSVAYHPIFSSPIPSQRTVYGTRRALAFFY